jgi:hypothetical protein
MARIYIVKDTETQQERLIEANSTSQSITHVAQGRYEARIAKTGDVARLMGQDVKVEVAGASAEPPAENPETT